MERFLSKCAKYIFKKNNNDLQNICVVFPNRRSGVFFNSYLQSQLSKPIIGPEVITVNELISGSSNIIEGDKLQLILELYKVFKKHIKTNESFDDFYFWGEVLLSDFNDVDRYLINAEDIFINISDLKKLDTIFDYLSEEQKEALMRFWGSVANDSKKENEQKFLVLWQKLYPIYSEFRNILEQKGIGYSGMISRGVVDLLDENKFDPEFAQYYIIGLNALNHCEEKFLSVLQRSGKATFLWDFDKLYIENKNNEAGHFIRKNMKKFPPPDDFDLSSDLFAISKNISFVAVSSNSGQAQEIPVFLNKINASFENEFDNTAIVLADEQLLFPALGAIPNNFKKVNVTMGYPVKSSVVNGFLNLLINLLKNYRQNSENEPVAYHRFITDILNHQLLGNTEPEKTKSFLSELKIYNRITIPLKEIDFSPFHKIIFNLPQKPENYSIYFLSVLTKLFEIVREYEENNTMLQELIYSTYQALEKLKSVIDELYQEQDQFIGESVYFRLLSQYLGQVSVAFEGEPLSGIQVMGILETRCLDFKNIIILGFNESKWPRSFTLPSFIPYNIRKGFDMPGIDEHDAMYAYYFYRLIQRAENITATYSTLKEGINTGELSRFGFQIRYDSELIPKMESLDFKFSNEQVKSIIIQNSEHNIKNLLERNKPERPFTPTALNTYLQCKLRYYFKYILQLPEPEEVKDEIDSPVFGNIFHETIEMLYQPFVGKMVTKKVLEKIRKDKATIENEILKAIGKYYFKYQMPFKKPIKLEGKTILIYENIKTFLNRLLEIDIEYAPFSLISLENTYTTKLILQVGNTSKPFFIGGKIDRVDKLGDRIRILDYKTGAVSSFSFKTVEELFERDLEKPKKEILQALYYSYILKNNLGSDSNFQPVIYGLRKLFELNHSPEIKWDKNEFSFDKVEDDFLFQLQNTIHEILSDKTVFYQTAHERICQYCPNNMICQRY